MNNIEDEGTQDDTAESEEDDLFGDFPSIDFREDITEDIGKREKDGTSIECQTSELRHLRRSDIGNDEDHTKECREDREAKRSVHGAECRKERGEYNCMILTK